MLADDTLKRLHLDAVGHARRNLEAAVAAIGNTCDALDRAALRRRVQELETRAEAAGTLPLDMPGWPGALETIRTMVKGGPADDGTLRDLARRLDDDARWRSHRANVRAAVDRLADLQARRPRHDGNADAALAGAADRHAWLRDAADVARALEAATAALPDRERAAHLAACGTTPDAVRRFTDGIPAWREADAALGRLAGWRDRVSRALRDGDAAAAGPLVEEGRNLPLAAAAPFLGDASAVRTMIADSTARLDAVLLDDACATFARLTGSVDNEAKAKDIHPLDTADWPRLVEAMTLLAGRGDVPAATRNLVTQWQEAHRRWRAERHEAAGMIRRSLLVKTERMTHHGDAGGRSEPLPDSWRRDAESLLADARALPGRDRHIRALGGDGISVRGHPRRHPRVARS